MSQGKPVAHTPGPWHVDATEDDCVPEFVYDSKGLGVADAVRDRPREECLANARLIAAAPTMLEALEGALKWIADLAASGDAGNFPAINVAEWVKGMEIIRKVKGESQ